MQRCVQTFLQRRVDGIVLTGIDHDPRSVDVLKLSRTPVVETWNLSGPFIDMGVGFSLYDAAKDMVRYLISKGRPRIGFAGYAPARNPRFLERQCSWRDALEEAGLIANLVSYCDEAKGFEAGGLAMCLARVRFSNAHAEAGPFLKNSPSQDTVTTRLRPSDLLN